MGDRRVLLIVSPEAAMFSYDGVGSFASVQDAVDVVPLNNQVRTIIRIASGVHRHPVYIPKSKNSITLCGSPIKDTVISWDNTASCIKHNKTSKVIGTRTSGSATVLVEEHDFIAENVVFENSAPQVYGQTVSLMWSR